MEEEKQETTDEQQVVDEKLPENVESEKQDVQEIPSEQANEETTKEEAKEETPEEPHAKPKTKKDIDEKLASSPYAKRVPRRQYNAKNSFTPKPIPLHAEPIKREQKVPRDGSAPPSNQAHSSETASPKHASTVTPHAASPKKESKPHPLSSASSSVSASNQPHHQSTSPHSKQETQTKPAANQKTAPQQKELSHTKSTVSQKSVDSSKSSPQPKPHSVSTSPKKPLAKTTSTVSTATHRSSAPARSSASSPAKAASTPKAASKSKAASTTGKVASPSKSAASPKSKSAAVKPSSTSQPANKLAGEQSTSSSSSSSTPSSSSSTSSSETENQGTFSKIVVIAGPSGVGKSTVIKAMIAQYPDSFGFSVSHTTRKPRPGEENGVAYHFVEQDEYDKMVSEGLFLEHAAVHGNYYGSSVEAVRRVTEEQKKICIMDIDICGCRQIKERKDSIKPAFIRISVDKDELRRRLTERGTETEESLAIRLKNAEGELAPMPQFFDLEVTNNIVDDCAREILEFLKKSKILE
ncbi:Guanylate kinase [Monocercomonoides exilis]|uniref:Guanylate kinase n=1 Tax=Monocercomonoides exilis TaxID=2049356 RepID=UPI003559F9E6|nr:Guanylate kinase [Monocercomonoides exilis]|eukprot:MONOS_1032.1-p1 / transcript=MONOS_1032.1 / gene=MONOS_1032 / organism=Monocercomonoides_exilis_PA203 / gene_product=Guanylate kinase [EC:2.7.4.8] / transcript_product=Guanylate kinase [EC:2.7.4.8] / location=Mono_scaffold00017:144640-146573(-) / protein_length=524 / sequence_SO=supercontig / SO=protein_coding / is_pseudo=false